MSDEQPVEPVGSTPEPEPTPVEVPEPGAVPTPATDPSPGPEVTPTEPEVAPPTDPDVAPPTEPEVAPAPTTEPDVAPVPEPGTPAPVPTPEPGAVPAAPPAPPAPPAEPEAPAPEPTPTPAPSTATPAGTEARPAVPDPVETRPTSLVRELILPAVRVGVPDRPSDDQVAALAARGPDDWTTSARDRVTRQVVRLAVAQVLTARVAQPRPAGVPANGPTRPELPTDPAEVTLRQAAGLFRPHVDLAAQAFRLAVVEAVNAGVPAAVDPVREGLRRLGVTGRDPLRMVALGLDRVPGRGRQAFWQGLAGSATVTALVADLAAGPGGRSRDVSGLDRGQLARADALVLAGGRTTPVVLGGRPADQPGGWLQVPLVVSRRQSGPGLGGPGGTGGQSGQSGQGSHGGRPPVEVAVRGPGWSEVAEVALLAVSAAMTEIDLGSRPRSMRPHGLADAVAGRLAAAADRTVAEVCASLRDVEPDVLEVFDTRVTTTPAPLAVPVPEEEQLAQLWLPGSALAAPLFTVAADLHLGSSSDVRAPGRSGAGQGAGSGRSGGSGTPGPRRPRPAAPSPETGREAGRPGQPAQPGGPGEPGTPGSRSGRSRRGGRGRRRTDGPATGAGGGTPDPV